MSDKQNELLEELKLIYSWQHSHLSDILYYLAERDSDMFNSQAIRIYDQLSEEEYVKVVNEFSKWIIEKSI
ncbi:hypothetical protein CBA12_15415 [Listeria monocytogenes]|uniref:hypothetical protein n=1 Tax=Vagococcus TaxID=2737 RepID=UPI000F18797B|nr:MULTISPECIES: hypothetical protein [Vagococcus]EAC3539366.1 hypothetical protein [Listeria monocytogenes]EAC4946926.1 hypothetical protein [Listeria monocytogenes]EAC5853068.1 hypothetical protein [Listeria monocytogenes]EAC5911174.1 hypothetical protein [Listeria monocytogenes]EAD0573345.1 hypothetical protein [Listeria monocytogenes]